MRYQNALSKKLDQWSNLDYKDSFHANIAPQIPPGWIPEDDERRLRAYNVFESYFMNSARYWLQSKTLGESEVIDAQKNRREYGDAELLVETALSSLHGDKTTITTSGAIEADADPAAVLQHEAILDWAEKEKFDLKFIECERSAVKFGDGVYVLGWDATVGRARLQVYDPGFYFPVFDPRAGGAEDFPTKVHIAWEFEEEDARGQTQVYVRKITWELVPVEPYIPKYASDVMATTNCRYTDGIWELSEIGKDISTLGVATVNWITEEAWLETDFIPVVHVPNTVNLQGHFGKSVLANVLQILDDVAATDTDIAASASTTGTPPIVVSGRGHGSGKLESYGPGTTLYVGEGQATILDTSSSLDALLKLKDALLSRLSINSRTPEALLGRVKPNEVPSGIALTLGFTPHINLIREMRMVRKEKYALLFKFVVRFMQMSGQLPLGPVFRTDLSMGSFLPADKQEAMTLVMNLYSSKVISLETAVTMLVESGYPIEDWVEELGRIQSRDYSGAMEIMTLTGNPQAAMDHLGLDYAVAIDPMEEEDPDQDV